MNHANLLQGTLDGAAPLMTALTLLSLPPLAKPTYFPHLTVHPDHLSSVHSTGHREDSRINQVLNHTQASEKEFTQAQHSTAQCSGNQYSERTPAHSGQRARNWITPTWRTSKMRFLLNS